MNTMTGGHPHSGNRPDCVPLPSGSPARTEAVWSIAAYRRATSRPQYLCHGSPRGRACSRAGWSPQVPTRRCPCLGHGPLHTLCSIPAWFRPSEHTGARPAWWWFLHPCPGASWSPWLGWVHPAWSGASTWPGRGGGKQGHLSRCVPAPCSCCPSGAGRGEVPCGSVGMTCGGRPLPRTPSVPCARPCPRLSGPPRCVPCEPACSRCTRYWSPWLRCRVPARCSRTPAAQGVLGQWVGRARMAPRGCADSPGRTDLRCRAGWRTRRPQPLCPFGDVPPLLWTHPWPQAVIPVPWWRSPWGRSVSAPHTRSGPRWDWQRYSAPCL